MAWDRHCAEEVQAPAPLFIGRWAFAAGVAITVGVLLFFLSASNLVPQMQAANIWVLAAAPLLAWVLVFSARAYAFGNALERHEFLKAEADNAQESWQVWAQRYLAVHASCVVLPDHLSALTLTQAALNLPPRDGQARRIAALPAQGDRAQTGLQLLVQAMATVLLALPKEQPLRVTLLSDVPVDQRGQLQDAWEESWTTAIGQPSPANVNVASELPCQWVNEKLKTASADFELVVVLQVSGEGAYSDGLAALLLCPDKLADAWDLPVLGKLLRPMPVDITALKSELPLFLQSQTCAGQATAVLADSLDWQPALAQIAMAGSARGTALNIEQQWIQERFSGQPGPLGHWLVAALGVEAARHQQAPLLLLAHDQSQHWISTVTSRDFK
ncbi:hypothetical protein [Pseudomonas mandelii]|uniref:hypothetical protein n=1 Tax=Pseudomonas mandelii TaxID=75612 RepID=UPI00224A9126|nr:hypothetical protein [Pseudomonas mandelii]MCX2900420.1 hypothetical protein [Pseudomonas mandelii]